LTLSSALAGVTFSLIPAWDDPTVTTATSFGATSPVDPGARLQLASPAAVHLDLPDVPG